MKLISPSLLSADFGHLVKDVEMINRSAADWLHVDVMDGVFVPNISFGFPIMKVLQKHCTKPLDVHLMITHPERYVERFVDAGAYSVGFHLEAVEDPRPILELIRNKGAKTCLTINPDIPVESLFPYLKEVDMILLMSVFAGYGGQAFIPETFDRLRILKAEINRQFSLSSPPHGGEVLGKCAALSLPSRRNIDNVSEYLVGGGYPLIEIDGGVNTKNAPLLFEAGADVLVAGSAVFHAKDPEATILKMKE